MVTKSKSEKSTSYKRPPITEAVIGINFADAVDAVTLRAAKDKYVARYSQSRQFEDIQFAVDLNANAPSSDLKKKVQTGYRLSSDDLTQLLVLRPSSFTLSQLAPYSGWEDFFGRFKRDWKVWKRFVGFRNIERVGVRYINRIDIPVQNPSEGSIIEESTFLNVYPTVPEMLSPFEAYSVQTTTALKDIHCKLTLNSAVVPSPLLEHLSFVVDQDIGKSTNPPQSDADLFDLLDKIRTKKNSVFEACVSDKARELFQQ